MLLTLRMVLKKNWEFNRKTYVAFLGLKKLLIQYLELDSEECWGRYTE